MTTKPFRILHLSDIHFGKRFFLYNEQAAGDSNAWAIKLADDLERGLERNGVRDASLEKDGLRQFDLLAVSGDLTWNSDEIGMQAAERFFSEVQGTDGRPGRWWAADDMLLIPGNHDMFFGEKPKNVEPPGLLVKVPTKQREALYRSTYRNITGKEIADDIYLGVVKSYPEHRLMIFGLNSCRLESWVAPGVGFVGSDQVSALGEAALLHLYEPDKGAGGKSHFEGWHRMTFLHHHVTGMGQVSWAAFRNFKKNRHATFTLDAEEIIQGLQLYGVDFILHGHYHRPETRRISNTPAVYGRVLSAGSAGVTRQLCSDLHHFFVLEIKYTGEASSNGPAQRVLEVKSFERPLSDSGPGEWAVKRSETFAFTEKPGDTLDAETIAKLKADAHLAESFCRTYGSWPAAVLFLTMLDSPEWNSQATEISKEFEITWAIRRQSDPSFPKVLKALGLLMRRVQANGRELLQAFAEELDSDDARPLADFLVERIADDPDLRKGQ